MFLDYCSIYILEYISGLYMINVLGLIVLNVIVFQKKNLSFIVMSVGMATRGSGACFSLSPASAPIPTIYDMGDGFSLFCQLFKKLR
jgi:hypothetical protein